ncbi:TetR/AcrR family transcriptional regulator [Rhizohabitans arisaemae]|uniref:TetR/AcrR family transcriptional regulator n=1 Tax=Rhizohabitans arisaemae TaxID=2720610 RepID=UPI0024B0FF63|nr:TetR/AcrR family transcriptional regulator [Rhizohabitans arisaemae]
MFDIDDRDPAIPANVPAERLDRRVRRTKQAIRHALIELMLRKGYDGVTVTDIINDADVGRSTFYSHFAGKEEVFLDILEDLGEAFGSKVPLRPGRVFAFSLPLLEHIDQERHLVRALLGRHSGTAIQGRIREILAEVVRAELLAALPAGAAPPPDLDLTVTCVVGAFMGLIARCVDEDVVETPAQLNAAFHTTLGPGVSALLRTASAVPDRNPRGRGSSG